MKHQVNTYITAASMEMLNAVMARAGLAEFTLLQYAYYDRYPGGGQKITITYDNNDCSGKLYLKGNVVSQDGTYPGPRCSQPIYWTYKYTSGDTTFSILCPSRLFNTMTVK